MNITSEIIQGIEQIALICTQGDLDASNYQDLITAARQVYEHGSRRLLIDMSNTSFMSSSGLVALHTVTLIMQGLPLPDSEMGWGALHAINGINGNQKQQYVKLINLQPQVDRALDKTGLKSFFEIFPNREEAIASYSK
jgi:anti-anti-sigma regulatory factor